MTQTPEIRTVGHGNHEQAAFADLLRMHGIQTLVDVRSRPYSRRNRQFNRELLESSLGPHAIRYVWMGKDLGGFRKSASCSRHTGLNVDGFRGYADYMDSGSFRAAADTVIEMARDTRVVLMCAELDPSRCHRQFIADYLVIREFPVVHILGDGSQRPHRLHECLRVVAARLIYDRGSQRTLV